LLERQQTLNLLRFSFVKEIDLIFSLILFPDDEVFFIKYIDIFKFIRI
jgi:hypothetical protein